MDNIMELLPFVIPLAIVQFSLFGYALYHILTHRTYKRGKRALWVALSLISFVGPILYFLLGREDA